MTNNINDSKDEVPDGIFNSNVLTEKEPVGILQMINTGTLSRFASWKVLQLVHSDELRCGLPQYGILTVFSLSKDIEQFNSMFDQGCDMLRDENILSDDMEKEAFNDLNKIIAKKSKKSLNVSNPINKLKKKKKTNSN